MKYCVVYKTRRKTGVYLFVEKKGHFERIPEGLMQELGKPELVMMLPLNNEKNFNRVSHHDLVKGIEEQGYFLQLPEKEENLLHEHRSALGLDAMPPKKEF
ncbi:YcgL domain-containing protein [Alteromonas sp. 5E99-2]|nr:YcgL domain-containing protein [Alteromonas sp. 5E99-2]MBO1255147.1 YcgL domain-containing protein [Alteromonas sp. 5E99-2]